MQGEKQCIKCREYKKGIYFLWKSNTCLDCYWLIRSGEWKKIKK
jgi:nitrate reductase beta subunit